MPFRNTGNAFSKRQDAAGTKKSHRNDSRIIAVRSGHCRFGNQNLVKPKSARVSPEPEDFSQSEKRPSMSLSVSAANVE